MTRGEVSWRWRWLALTVVLGAGGCVFIGGQTGDESGIPSACTSSRPIGFAERSSLGYSAADVLARLGNTRTANITAVDATFWQMLGIDPAPALPLPVVLSVTNDNGAVTEHECASYLSIQVSVSLDAGNGLLERAAVGTLDGTLQSADLTVVLAPPAAADASALPITLDVRLTSTSVQGELAAGTPHANATVGP
jgi:hypothetical protein